MKITDIQLQVRNSDRVNVSIDGKYRFSLDILQVSDLGVKIGRELNQAELEELEQESQFGKLYSRALEYSFMRPRSVREVRDYLWRKTRDRRGKEGQLIKGYAPILTDRVLEKLQQKNHVNDEKFARWWVESRNQTKGISLRKLAAELRAKGVDRSIIEQIMAETDRNDDNELMKMIVKKRSKYPDDNKLVAYLARQGFSYDDIKRSLYE